jgi:hypothetical protein
MAVCGGSKTRARDASKSPVADTSRACLVIGVVSTGHRNTRTKSQVQEFKWLSVAREHKCEEKAFGLGKSELRPQRIGPQKRIVRSNDQRGVASTS